MKDWVTFLHFLADIADHISLKNFQTTDLKISIKPDNTPVTIADKQIEEKIIKRAKQEFPKISFLSEEFNQENKPSDLKLIIDPIDGTKNFIRGIPFFATLLAIEEKGKITAGLISAPYRKERWWASKNQGAFYNYQSIEVSKIKIFKKAQAFYSSLFGQEAETMPKSIFKLLKKTGRTRGFGDYYSHMLVAMGHGEFAFDFGVKPWDIAPIKIILEEAGGKLTDQNGIASIYNHSMITSNGILHDKILGIIH